jgi:competence protein ComEA
LGLKLRKIINDYFEYYPFEKKGLLIAGGLILIWTIGLYVYSRVPLVAESDQGFILAVEEYQKSLAKKNTEADTTQIPDNNQSALFYFNPNTISGDSLLLLGLPERTVKAMLNYREKGGRFKNAEQLAKIYTLNKEDYNRIAPFVSIEETHYEVKNLPAKEPFYFKADSTRPTYKTRTIVELNRADTLQLIQIRGIGAFRAKQIVEYREALGGFISIDQLLEIYKLDHDALDQIEPFITIDSNLVNKININKVTLERLKKHPYLRYSVANSLVNLRKAQGPYRKMKDLYRSDLMNDSIYKRIRPYIKLND